MADQLCHILWPDEVDVEAARRRLHVRVSQLRQLLSVSAAGSPLLTVDGGYLLSTDGTVALDVAAFEAAVSAGRRYLETNSLDQAIQAFEAACELYGGDFLAEDLYASWTFLERERLLQLNLSALMELAEAYALQGRYRRAVRLCEQILTVDPIREAVYYRLMLYHFHAGDQGRALQLYAQCRRQLAAELGVVPLPAMQELAERIRRGDLSPESDRYPSPLYAGRLFAVPYSLGNPPLVGREREYGWLAAGWRDPQRRLLLIGGPAGVGKSFLLRYFCNYVTGEGAETFISPAEAAGLPYTAVLNLLPAVTTWPLDELPPAELAVVRPLLPALQKRELPPLPQLPPAAAARRLQRALVSLSQLLLPPQSVLLLDDAHLADNGSLAVLAALAATHTCILAYREENWWPTAVPVIRAMLQRGAADQLNLAPLREKDVVSLINQLGKNELGPLSEQIARETGGIPFFVIATLQQLFEEGGLYAAEDGKWRLTAADWALPPSIEQAINRRLHACSREQQQLLDAAAVGGAELDYGLLLALTGWKRSVLLMVADDLLTGGWLVEPRRSGAPELRLAHAYLRDVIYTALPEMRRQHLHGETAVYLAAAGRQKPALAPAVARHFLAAGEASEAVSWLVAAGDAALARSALQEAVDYFEQAVAIQPDPAVYDKIGHAAHQLAWYERSVQAYRAARRLWAEADEAAALRSDLGMAESCRELSDFATAATAARHVLERLRELQGEPTLLAQAHITLSNAYRSGQLAEMAVVEAHLQKGMAAAKRAGNMALMGEANFWLGVVAINCGDALTALAYDEIALELFLDANHAGWQAIVYNNVAYHALLAGRPRRGLAAAEQGLALAREVAARNSEVWLLSTLGEIQLHLGEVVAAEKTLTEGLALVREYGPPRLEPGYLADLAQAALARGDADRAVRLLRAALAAAGECAPQFVPRLRVLLAAAYLQQGASAAAEEAAQAAAAAVSKGQSRVFGQALRLQGIVAARSGGCPARKFAHSHEILTGNGDTVEAARTDAAWGLWLLSCDRVMEAESHLNSADKLFRSSEAVLDQVALERERKQIVSKL